MRALLLIPLLVAVAAAAPDQPGSTLPRLVLEDQHGRPGEVDERVRVLVFTREMKGGDVVKEALAGVDQQFLDARGIVYVADIARMPGMVTRLIALPRMRKRPYRMLLDREGAPTRDLPASEGKATVLHLDRLRIAAQAEYGTPAELKAALDAVPPAAEVAR